MLARVFVVLAVSAVVLSAAFTCPDAQCTSNAVVVNYDQSVNAASQATTSISLDNNFIVTFTVANIKPVVSGHVVYSAVSSSNVSDALLGLTRTTGTFWAPDNCDLNNNGLDLPAAALGVTVTRQANCTRTASVSFSLSSSTPRSGGCSLVSQDGTQLIVNCTITVTTVSAMSLTEPDVVVRESTTFYGSIVVPTSLPVPVAASLAASNVRCAYTTAPAVMTCRIPAPFALSSTILGTFSSFTWVDLASCTSSTGTSTVVTCNLNPSTNPAGLNVTGTLTATVQPDGQTFSWPIAFEYLPFSTITTVTTSGPMAAFVTSAVVNNIGTTIYGPNDQFSLSLKMADPTLVDVTSVLLSNSAATSYEALNYPVFLTDVTKNATHINIKLFPAKMVNDSLFYAEGPHTIAVTLIFHSSTRRQGGGEAVVSVGGVSMGVVAASTPVSEDTPAVASPSGSSSGASQTTVIALAAGVVGVVGAIAAAAVVTLRRKSAKQAAKVAEAPAAVVASV